MFFNLMFFLAICTNPILINSQTLHMELSMDRDSDDWGSSGDGDRWNSGRSYSSGESREAAEARRFANEVREERLKIDARVRENAERCEQEARSTIERAERLVKEAMRETKTQAEKEEHEDEMNKLRESNRPYLEALKDIKAQEKRVKTVRNQITGMDNYEVRSKIVETASDALGLSKQLVLQHNFEESKIARDIAITLLDLATSILPGVGWLRDLGEAVTGRDLISGANLDTFSHSMAILGAVTGGIGSKVGKVLGRLIKGQKAVEAIKASEKILDLASSAGDKWSRTAKTLQDQMTFNAAQKGAENPIIKNLGDTRYKGMEKWEYRVKSIEGKDSVVHYVRDPETKNLMDFKFTKHSID